MFLICLSLVISHVLGAFPVILGENNYSSFVTGSKMTLVMFYAPWCGHSKAFMEPFDQIAFELSLHGVPAAKVDCVEHKKLYWDNGIEAFPTLKMVFGDGSIVPPVTYKGERAFGAVIEFSRKQFQTNILTSDLIQSELADFMGEFLQPVHPLLLLLAPGVTEQEPYLKLLEFMCKQMDSLKCAFSVDPALSTDLTKSATAASLVVIRDFLGEASILTHPVPPALSLSASSNDNLYSWVLQSAFPLLTEFSQENEPLLFSDTRPGYNSHVVFVVDSKASNFELISRTARETASASEFVGKCVFVYIDVSRTDSYVNNILEDIGVSRHEAPTALIIRSQKTQVQFFRLDPATAITLNNINMWASDALNGRLTASRVVDTARVA